MSPAVVLAPVATFLSIVLLTGGWRLRTRQVATAKMRRYAACETATGNAVSPSFDRRVLLPALEAAGSALAAAAPAQGRDRWQGLLDRAGNPINLHSILALRGLCMLGLPAVCGLAFRPAGQPLGLLDVAIALLLFALGGYLPKQWLLMVVKKRQRAIARALPDALDLVVVSMEAGLALDGALTKVVDKTRGPLRDELRRTLHEIALGGSRRDSLRQLGRRTGVKDLVSLMNSVVQADQMGVSMAQAMRMQAAEARLKRRQQAEERAHGAAVKMLFPLVLFILPSVLIVTVGPAALAIYAQFSKGIFN